MKPQKSNANHNLDTTDIAILNALQKDGRMSYAALAESVFLSTSPCHERVRKLEKMQYIQGYGARLNEKLLGFGKLAFLQISLEKTVEPMFLDFHRQVAKNPLVIECHMVAGGYDYLLKSIYQNIDQFRVFLGGITAIPGVINVQSIIVIEQIKSNVVSELPLQY